MKIEIVETVFLIVAIAMVGSIVAGYCDIRFSPAPLHFEYQVMQKYSLTGMLASLFGS